MLQTFPERGVRHSCEQGTSDLLWLLHWAWNARLNGSLWQQLKAHTFLHSGLHHTQTHLSAQINAEAVYGVICNMWGLHTVWWLLLSNWGLIKGWRHENKQIISLAPVGRIKVMDTLTVPPVFLLLLTPCVSSLLLLIHPCPPGTNLLLFTSCEWSKVQTLWLVKLPLRHKGEEFFSLDDKWLQGRQALHLHGIYPQQGIFFSIPQLPADSAKHCDSCERVYEFKLTCWILLNTT